MERLWVITSTELGWDCVVATFVDSVTEEELEAAFPANNGYVIHSKPIYQNTEPFKQ